MCVQNSDIHVTMACANFKSIFDLVKVYLHSIRHIHSDLSNMFDTDNTCAAIMIACLMGGGK